MTHGTNSGDRAAGPPKEHQFKKGEPSACPDGGWARKRAKKREREQAMARKQKEEAKKLENLVRRIAFEQRLVTTNRGPISMTKAEIIVRQTLDRGMKADASDREVARAIALLERAKLLDPAPEKGKSGVLVVYPIRTEEDWERATAGERLPKDPLAGIPGAEGLLDNEPPPRRLTPPEDD